MTNFGVKIKKLTKGQWVILIVVFLLVMMAAFATLIHLSGKEVMYINSSMSAPRGVYMISPSQTLHRGDYVVVRTPEAYPGLHVPEGYNLLKQVKGFPGDIYVVTKTEVRFDKNYPLAPDTEKYSYLPRLPVGAYRIQKGEHLYLNDVDGSFDGRYIGPITDNYIVEKVFLLIDYEALDRMLVNVPILSNLQTKTE